MSDPAVETERVYPAPGFAAKKTSRASSTLLFVGALVAVAGVAFAIGRFTVPAAATPGGPPGGGFQVAGPDGSPRPGAQIVGRDAGGGPTFRGEVTAVSDDSITIKLEDGSSITVPLNDQTTYHTATAGSPADVSVGKTVAVQAGPVEFQPGSSPDPAVGRGDVSFGPAADVMVITD